MPDKIHERWIVGLLNLLKEKSFKPFFVVLLVAANQFFLAEAFAACPIELSADSSTAVNDSGTANCAVTINSGVSLTTTGSAVTLSGSGSTATNQGTITVNTSGFGIIASGSNVKSISNLGSIYNNGTQASISNTNVLETVNNSGLISSAGGNGVINNGSLTNLINTGSISGGSQSLSAGVYNNNTRTITTITNTGSIVGIYGIKNLSTIGTLNNAQGGNSSSASTTALTYTGNLPTNYNIIVNSLSSYGQLSGTSVTGSTTFGIYSGSTLTKGTYTSVLAGLSSGTNVSATSGTFNGTGWRLVLNSGTTWDLIVDASAINTLAAVQQNASGLATTFNTQAAALQAGLTYDCNTFDDHGLCASVGGRTTYGLTAPVGNQQAGLLIVSHRPDPHFRFGVFADQSVNSAMPNGIKQNNSGPMYGAFGYWNHQKDSMGLGASISATAANSNLTISRNASLANTEAGSGNTEMQGQAIQAQATYAVQATDRIKAIPYGGLRYYRVASGGYSEGSNSDVTSPLTYNAMAQEVFAAVGGVGTSVFLAEKLTGTASVGIQQNLNYKMGNYQGTSSISGLESFSVNMPSNINSMTTATAGMSYVIKKNEKLGVNVLWQQQAFSATNTITALATYSIGF